MAVKSLGTITENKNWNWGKDAYITADTFDETTVLSPGIRKSPSKRDLSSVRRQESIAGGDAILLPEKTAAYISVQSELKEILTTPGVYEYLDDKDVRSDSPDPTGSHFPRFTDRRKDTSSQALLTFVNLREIRGIKFGTRGPQRYRDQWYGCDLELCAYGTFSLQISDPELFIRYYAPTNTNYYSFADSVARAEILPEFLRSFTASLSPLSGHFRISHLRAHAAELLWEIENRPQDAGTWGHRFGMEITGISILHTEYSSRSAETINQIEANRQKRSYHAADTVSGGRAERSEDSGGPKKKTESLSIEEQIETVKKLKELFDEQILTEEEYQIKKKEVLGL